MKITRQDKTPISDQTFTLELSGVELAIIKFLVNNVPSGGFNSKILHMYEVISNFVEGVTEPDDSKSARYLKQFRDREHKIEMDKFIQLLNEDNA